MNAKIVRLMFVLLRIGAVICGCIAIWILCAAARMASAKPSDREVTSKNFNEQHPSYWVSMKSSNTTYTIRCSESFYNEAKPGDTFSGSMEGYAKLMRNGRVVAHYYCESLVFSIAIGIAALVPLIVFLPTRNRHLKLAVISLAAAFEVGVLLTVVFTFTHAIA